MAFNINQLNFDYQNGLSQITLQANDGTDTIINITVPVEAAQGSAATPAQIKQAAVTALQGAIEALS